MYKKEKEKFNLIQQNENRIDELNNKLQTINNNLDKIYNDRLNNLLDEDDFERIYKLKKNERNNIQAEIELLKRLENSNKNNELSYEKELEILLKKFLDMKKPNKMLIFSLIDRIELTKDLKVIIKFKFSNLDGLM